MAADLQAWAWPRLHQHGNDRDVPTERFLDFETHEVLGVIEPARAGTVAGRRPSLSDDDEYGGRFAQRRLQDADEVCPRIDRVDVQEHLSSPEAPVHVIGKPTGLAGRVVSSVTDEDPWWHQVIN
jgi:hypothetical protein